MFPSHDRRGKPVLFSGDHELINFDLTWVDLRGLGVGDNLPKLLQRANAPANEFVLTCNNQTGGSTNPADNATGIRLQNFEVVGRVATEGFLEQCHLVAVSAVTDLEIRSVKFTGFKGDGLYIGSGLGVGGVERHNRNIKVFNCIFDGVNRDNRNSQDGAADLYYNDFRQITQGQGKTRLKYSGNIGENGVIPFYVRGSGS